VPRILFIKTSSLGDVVHNCPAVSDVARCVPGAVIDWVVEDSFAEVAALHGAVRRVIPVSIRRWRSDLLSAATWSEFLAFRAALRAERYDAVIDSQGLAKSALLAAMARGRKHGLDRASVREPFAARFYDSAHAVSPALHAVERNRRLAAAALGYEVPAGCDYGLSAAGEPPIRARKPYALLLTMTSRDDKLWAEENWRALGHSLEARGLHCLLPWGTEEERRRCARIATAIAGAVVPPRMSLTGLARLAREARCVVGVDTGLAHLAAALDVPNVPHVPHEPHEPHVPVVGLYCGSDPALTGLHGNGRVHNLGGAGKPPAVAEVKAVLEALC
jgi:heptosyltransferase-1